MSTFEHLVGTEIAVVGMTGRFPGARDLDEFWRNLCDGVESIRFPDDDELKARGVDPTLLQDPNYVKAVAVLDGMELFDAAFFGYTPREAELMDPQQRIFLECAWEALENAGYDPATCQEAIGVFAGATTNTYLLLNLVSNPQLLGRLDPVQIDVGNGADFLSTRVSYKLNLKGPSYTVQTACSTSLVAVHLACQSLLNDECDLALAGGVSVHVGHPRGYYYLEGSIVSPDGHCRAFDAQANGTVFGSGVGVVALKRLEDALAQGDRVHAVIRGSALNNDGSLKVGYTAPSVEGQAAVITEALAVAGVEAGDVSYVETHGTGTQLGDPIEVRALSKAFGAVTERKNYCALGSVKTNIGHLAGAAGVASLIKAVLALENQRIPPSLHFERPNPEAGLEDSPFFVNTTLAEWQTDGAPRRAGVSSFGVGGTNAHVVLEEAPPVEASGPSRAVQLLLLSAKTDTALETATDNLLQRLRDHPDLALADVAYTLKVGRQAFSQRRVLVCRDLEDAVQALEARDPQRVLNGAPHIQDRPVVFMFSGQGAQYVNMARELYQAEPVFCEQVDRCAGLLQPHLGLDLRDVLFPPPGQEETATGQLTQTALTQPALFVIEYALAQLWIAWGVRPQAMMGHSIGEYVAACLAGVFSLQDALALVAARGRLMGALPGGSMMAVLLPEEKVRPFLGADLSLAVVNGPSLCAVSGPAPAVEALQTRLDEAGVEYRPLHTSHAFHSAMMDPILEPFAEKVRQTQLNAPQIPYLSNVSGTWITDEQATDPAYYAQHLRQAVRFADGVRELTQDPAQVLLEVGPGNTLARLARQQADTRSQTILASTRHPREEKSDLEFLLTTLGKLWLAGVDVDWAGFYAGQRRRRLPLPTYPFERGRFWIERGDQAVAPASPPVALHKKADLGAWFYAPAWKSSPPPRPFRPANLSGETETWLLFVDASGLGTEMARRLRDASQTVVTVAAGEAFGRVEDGAYTINPRQKEDYVALLNEIGAPPARVVQLWSLTPEHDAEAGLAFFERCQELGLYSLLFLAQALGEQAEAAPVQIEVVSDHVCSVLASETSCPEKATLLGPCTIIPQEYPHVTCRYVDVGAPGPERQRRDRLVAQLLAEISAAATEATVAYRGGQRWVQTFEPTPLDDEAEPLIPLRPQGVYFISGGASGMGLDLARYLAETIAARLVLVDETAPADGQLDALEASGAQVLAINADVADVAQMQTAVAQAVDRFGRIHGVIHAAGVLGEKAFRPIQETDAQVCNWHFEPQVRGLFALEKALQGQALDFCVLNSSLSTVLGGVGYAAFAAADFFVDAFARRQNQTSPFPCKSVNWDAWQLQTEDAQITAVSADLAQLALTPAEGGQALRRILAASTTDQVVVSTADLAARIAQGRQRTQSLRDPRSQPLALHERPALHTDYVPPRNELEQQVMEIWQQVLGIKEIGVHDDFFDLGGHSLLATQLRNHLYEGFKVELPIRGLFEHATVAGVAQLIQDGLDQASQEDARPIAERLRTAFPTERLGLLETYLRPKIAQGLNLPLAELPEDGDLSAFDLELVAVDLMWNLKRDLELQFYPHEITACPSIGELARFVLNEYDRMLDLPALATRLPLSAFQLTPYQKRGDARTVPAIPDGKNKSMVFLHSSPRAGSTLLRVMLAGHPALFCPPELNLLFFEDMQEWRQNIGFGHDFQWTAQGLHWAFVELLGLETDEGWAFLDDLVAQNRSVLSVYAQLQKLAGERLLVDKTPPYAMDVQTLQRAEALFQSPKYIFLARHPYAVMESLLRLRFDRLFGPSLFKEEDVDPYVVVETVWALCTRNLLQFFDHIEPERHHLLRYEDLVSDPDRVMAGLCQFLDLPFDTALLNPYDGRRERMMGGLGDPNIFERSRIDPSLGEAWKRVKLPRPLDETTKDLALRLGYELPEVVETPPAIADRMEDQLLANLDELSDEQVYAMLSEMLADEE